MQGNYVYLNEHFTTRHAAYYKQGEIKSAAIALPEQDRLISQKIFLQCIESPEKCFPINLRKMDGKGGYIVTFWEYKANFSPNGEVDGVVGIGYDITTFESHKEYIRFLKSTLNDVADRQSHLVRRPLANILGLVEVLNQLNQPDETLQDITNMLLQSCKELNEEFEAFVIGDFSEIKSEKML
ncbi:MAG: hypothetical protein ACRYFL_00785 [Janthinobacterium lividum]